MITITKLTVHREDDNPIFGESVIDVELSDDAAGPYITISSGTEEQNYNMVKIEFEEFEEVAKAVAMLKNQNNIKHL